MSVFLQPIYTQTVTTGGSSITFNNIPQTFTDLKVEITGRSFGSSNDNIIIRFNSDSTASHYSNTVLAGYGTGGASPSSGRGAAGTDNYLNPYSPHLPVSTSTANTFSSCELYIPNYAGANYKQVMIDSVIDTNVAGFSGSGPVGVENAFVAANWLQTSAITSIFIGSYAGLAQYSTVSLYGVLRQGV